MKYDIRVSYKSGQEQLISCALDNETCQELIDVVVGSFIDDKPGILKVPDKYLKSIHFIRLSEVQHITVFSKEDVSP